MSSEHTAHELAMESAFLADLERKRGNLERSAELFESSLDLERQAISEHEDKQSLWWFILHRSASWLALDCKQPRLAEKIACSALAGDPDPIIANQLREVVEAANFRGYWESIGLELAEGEVHFSLAGSSVAYGVALLSDWANRATYSQSLFYRIAQRMLGFPYRDQLPSGIRNNFRTFASAPSPGSFSFSLRLGHPVHQAALPTFFGSDEVINEFMDLMDLANGNPEAHEISEKVQDPAYQRNFLGIARNIAPDGNRIRQVGLATSSSSGPRILAMTKPASLFTPPDFGEQPPGSTLEVSGILRYADAGVGSRHRNRIRLLDDNERLHNIAVPEGLMDDIVRPMWNSHVTVRGNRRPRQKIIRLLEIWESDPDSGQGYIHIRAQETAGSGNGFQQSLI